LSLCASGLSQSILLLPIETAKGGTGSSQTPNNPYDLAFLVGEGQIAVDPKVLPEFSGPLARLFHFLRAALCRFSGTKGNRIMLPSGLLRSPGASGAAERRRAARRDPPPFVGPFRAPSVHAAWDTAGSYQDFPHKIVQERRCLRPGRPTKVMWEIPSVGCYGLC
jgi:hypothetical protein